MQLTLIERMTLFNQFKILEKVDPEQADFYTRACEILENGFETEYPDLTEHFLEEISAEQGREIMDVLDMYQAMAHAVPSVTFPGFDANNEGPYLRYVEFLRNTGRWKTILGSDLDSHAPAIGRYRRMLAEWRESTDRHKLSAEDVQRIDGV